MHFLKWHYYPCMMKHFTLKLVLLVLATLKNHAKGVPKEALLSDRYVVGKLAEIEDFPFIASLRINSVHFCAVSIIHQSWAITAGQCYESVPINQYSIVSSTHQLKAQAGNHHAVENITLSDDGYLALIKVAKGEEFMETPAILTRNKLGNYEMAIIAGWGFTAHPGTTPKDLRMIYLRIFEDFACQLAYHHYKADSSLICTVPKTQSRGVCNGDVGAPLTANGKLYGVSVWRKSCLDGKPEIFYSVSYRHQWITNMIQ